GHPCPWLTVPTAKPVADFHRQVIARAGRTINPGRMLHPGNEFIGQIVGNQFYIKLRRH
ncbi:hypothetical protein HNR77_004026, partial [Paenibacillus sp. JGP012]|nr:hypothetical protein [Paenibacillus sp. JGP012]